MIDQEAPATEERVVAPPWWLPDVVVALVVLAAVASTWPGGVELGDAPESVVGAHDGAVLHPPGYPALALGGWVLARTPLGAHGGLLVVVATATLVAALLVAAAARWLGAGRWPAAVGATAYALASSVWFYAAYPKHDALTSALVAAVVALGAAAVAGRGRRPLLLGALVGASLAVGWFVVVPAAVPVAVVVLWGAPARRWLAAAAVALVTASAVLGVLAWRLAASPASWGHGGSVVVLVAMEDVGAGSHLLTGEDPAATKAVGAADLAGLGGELGDAVRVVAADVGLAVAVLAIVGLVLGSRRGAALLGGVAAIDLAVVALVLGVHPDATAGLRLGGFLAPVVVAAGVATGLGLDALARRCRRVAARRLVVGVAAAAVVVAGVGHRDLADHPDVPVALRHGTAVLAGAPPDAVLFVWAADQGFAPLLAQRHGVRPDVEVVAADGLTTAWYRRALSTRLDLAVLAGPPSTADPIGEAAAVAVAVGDHRPVALDPSAVAALGGRLPLRPVGLLAVVDPVPTSGCSRAVDAFESAVATVGPLGAPARRWPNEQFVQRYAEQAAWLARRCEQWGEVEAAARARAAGDLVGAVPGGVGGG